MQSSEEPFVVCTELVAAGTLIGLYASEICLAKALSIDERSSMWIIDLEQCDAYNGPPLAFSVITGGNLFRFMRHSSDANVQLGTTWLKGKPYLFCRALDNIEPGTELCYDWGSKFVSQLAWNDLSMAAGLSHALHRMASPIALEMQPSNLTVRLGRNECVISVGTEEHRIAINDMRNAKRIKRETTSVCARDLVSEYLDKRQVVTERARAILSAEKVTLPTWSHLFALKHHNRVRQLMTSNESLGVEIRRLDSLSHHVRWMSVPSMDQYGVFATRQLATAAPILMYKGRMCCEDELNESANDDCMHYNHTVPIGSLVIDSSAMGNDARFVNDAYGAGGDRLRNNCDFVWTWDEEHCEPALFIVPNRRIRSGEELLCDYGEAFWGEHVKLQMQSHCKYWYRRLFGVSV